MSALSLHIESADSMIMT